MGLVYVIAGRAPKYLAALRLDFLSGGDIFGSATMVR